MNNDLLFTFLSFIHHYIQVLISLDKYLLFEMRRTFPDNACPTFTNIGV